MKKTGIYKITCLANNKFYIGSSINIDIRKSTHFNKLSNNNHFNKKLQNSFNKHGKDSFVFEVLEYCEKEKLIEREQYYVDVLNPFYNINRIVVNTSLGVKRSEETKNKLKESWKPRPAWNKGLKLGKQSSELIEKRINGRSGYRHSTEIKNKIANSVKKSRKCNKVFVYDLDWNLIEEYDSVNDCQKIGNYFNVSKNCRTERISYNKRWSFELKTVHVTSKVA